MAIHNGILRLGRQTMAAHLHLLAETAPRTAVAFDGLRSFVASQDHPCDITTVVEPEGEVILTMAHTITRRGGTMCRGRRKRLERKEAVWRPKSGTMIRDISLVVRELWNYLRPSAGNKAMIDTDEHPLYRSVLNANPVVRHFRSAGLIKHIRTPGTAPRTIENRLFPVNYIDRLLRHRLKEHTRETIAFGRHAVMQMHRAWIFAYDHNGRREYRVKRPALGEHAMQGVVGTPVIRRLNRTLFTRRIRVDRVRVPESIRRVWMGELPTPPVRWRVGQKDTTVRVPAFARRDLLGVYQQRC
jgi:hypothetical protein